MGVGDEGTVAFNSTVSAGGDENILETDDVDDCSVDIHYNIEP